jgi:hypothetical protein
MPVQGARRRRREALRPLLAGPEGTRRDTGHQQEEERGENARATASRDTAQHAGGTFPRVATGDQAERALDCCAGYRNGHAALRADDCALSPGASANAAPSTLGGADAAGSGRRRARLSEVRR